MKRLVSFLLGVALIAGVLVVFVIFARHNGPGDSPRDDNNTKTVAASTTMDTTTSAMTTTGSSTTSTGTSGGGATISMAVAKTTFTQTCGGCHTLADAGTKGAVGPNLDGLKPSEATVAHQIMNGGGAMPAGLLAGAKLTAVAKYVSSVAGKNGAKGSTTTSNGGLP